MTDTWLPHSLSSVLPFWRGKGDFYYCKPLQLRDLEAMPDLSGMRYQNLCIESWRETFEIERPQHWSACLLRCIPEALLRSPKPAIPTLVC